jgi:hypothetical protein
LGAGDDLCLQEFPLGFQKPRFRRRDAVRMRIVLKFFQEL